MSETKAITDSLDTLPQHAAAPSSLISHQSKIENPLLLFEHASKWYGQVLALNQVTLTLTGGITGLVGGNGAGKSTLIKLAAGLIAPTIGRVTVGGLDASNWHARRLVGYCPDHDAFYEDLTGRQFVFEMAKLFGFARPDARRLTEEVLERVGMTDRADRKLRGYSKGMRQRVKLAQALLHDPPLLILDEPLSGIDPVGRAELLTLFRGLAQAGKCLLISSHELEELEKLTNHVAVMARGRIAAVGTLEQIRQLLDDRPFRVRVETDRPRELAKAVLDLDGVLGVDSDGDAVVIRAKQPNVFYRQFGGLVLSGGYDVRQLEPLDDAMHALLGHLLGGSGKT